MPKSIPKVFYRKSLCRTINSMALNIIKVVNIFSANMEYTLPFSPTLAVKPIKHTVAFTDIRQYTPTGSNDHIVALCSKKQTLARPKATRRPFCYCTCKFGPVSLRSAFK